MSPYCVSKRRKFQRLALGGFVGFAAFAAAFWLGAFEDADWLFDNQWVDTEGSDRRGHRPNHAHEPRVYVFDISNIEEFGLDKAGLDLKTALNAISDFIDGPGPSLGPDLGELTGYGPGGAIPAGSPNVVGGTFNQFGNDDGGNGGFGGFGRRRGGSGFGLNNPIFTSGGPGGDTGNGGNGPKGPGNSGNPGPNGGIGPNSQPLGLGPNGNSPSGPNVNNPQNRYDPLPDDGGDPPVPSITSALLIPEPSTLAMFAVGLFSAALFKRRRETTL